MNIENIADFDDLGAAIRECRPLNHALRYRIRLAIDGLDFQPADVEDPIPLGRQIATAGGLNPQHSPLVFAIVASGDFEEVRLDEPFDLRGQCAERFVAFRSDRTYSFAVNGAQIRWGQPSITGDDLRVLAQPAEGEAIFLDVPGGTDRLIEPGDAVDLTVPGVERFITAPAPQQQFDIVVNGHETTVNKSLQTFEDLVALAYPGEPPAPNITYSMTYRRAASVPYSGELATGGHIHVKNGSIVNVGRTVQS